jgi:hypothetical protein
MRERDPLAAQSEIIVSVGSPEPVEPVENATVLTTSEATWDSWKLDHAGYRLTRNALRAHRALAESDADLCVFAEDDVEVSTNWLTRAASLVERASRSHARFALCGCSSHPMWCFRDTVRVGSDSYVRFSDPNLFWGNQLLLYPRSTISAMTAHIQTCVAAWTKSRPKAIDPKDIHLFGDQTTKTFFAATKTPLFVSIPSLARHVGEENTWSALGGASVAFRDHPTARWKP